MKRKRDIRFRFDVCGFGFGVVNEDIVLVVGEGIFSERFTIGGDEAVDRVVTGHGEVVMGVWWRNRVPGESVKGPSPMIDVERWLRSE